MLKINLLTTTALVLIASCAVAQSTLAAGGQSGNGGAAIALAISPAAEATSATSAFTAPVVNPGCALRVRAQVGRPGRNRNAQFLHTYGYSVCTYHYYGHSSRASDWQVYAAPIKGTGNKISKIMVKECSSSSSPNFIVGVYTDDHGVPGKGIAGGRTSVNSSCGWTSATITPTLLKAGKKYWVVESNPSPDPARSSGCGGSSSCYAVLWLPRRTGRHNALYRYHTFYSSSLFGRSNSYTSPWLSVSGPRPALKVN